MARAHLSTARKTALITKTGFTNYDVCLNPYVGCEFGCTYCYVQFFIKDPHYAWGDFVRVREHISERLPRELDRGWIRLEDDRTIEYSDARLVLGTMTDPYQPVERRYRITRTALQLLAGHRNKFKRVGIFTRSPIVLDDIDLIAALPEARIHFTITPLPANVMRTIEPISPIAGKRWSVLEDIKAKGVRLHVNVSPVIPVLSDPFVEEFAERLAALEPDEFFVDPMQPYRQSYESFQRAMQGSAQWGDIEAILSDNSIRGGAYTEWKRQHTAAWVAAWRKYGGGKATLPMMCDHQSHSRFDLRTGGRLPWKNYGEDDLIL